MTCPTWRHSSFFLFKSVYSDEAHVKSVFDPGNPYVTAHLSYFDSWMPGNATVSGDAHPHPTCSLPFSTSTSSRDGTRACSGREKWEILWVIFRSSSWTPSEIHSSPYSCCCSRSQMFWTCRSKVAEPLPGSLSDCGEQRPVPTCLGHGGSPRNKPPCPWESLRVGLLPQHNLVHWYFSSIETNISLKWYFLQSQEMS